MAFVQKGQAFGQINQAIQLPSQFPEPPADYSSESMATWQKSVQAWWNDSQLSITRQFQTIIQTIQNQDVTAFETATNASLATLNSEFTSATTQLTTIIAELATVQQLVGSITTVSASLSALQASLTAHIAATSAHGTVGAIVGTTDAQMLDSKNIGSLVPGPGSFKTVLIQNNIPALDTVTVGSTQQFIAAQPYIVSGTLVVTGTAVFVGP